MVKVQGVFQRCVETTSEVTNRPIHGKKIYISACQRCLSTPTTDSKERVLEKPWNPKFRGNKFSEKKNARRFCQSTLWHPIKLAKWYNISHQPRFPWNSRGPISQNLGYLFGGRWGSVRSLLDLLFLVMLKFTWDILLTFPGGVYGSNTDICLKR